MGLLWGCSKSKVGLDDIKGLFQPKLFCVVAALWSISSDVNCVTSLLPHIVQELLLPIHCTKPVVNHICSHHLLKRDCEGVLWLEMCPGISWEWGFVWLMEVTLSGRRREGGKLVEIDSEWPSSLSWKVRAIHGNCPPASFLLRSAVQKVSPLCF